MARAFRRDYQGVLPNREADESRPASASSRLLRLLFAGNDQRRQRRLVSGDCVGAAVSFGRLNLSPRGWEKGNVAAVQAAARIDDRRLTAAFRCKYTRAMHGTAKN